MARSRKDSTWLKETSDQSGFDNFNRFGKKLWRSTKQYGLTIAPDEYDTPPPSTKPLGGADISGTPRADATSTAVPNVSQIKVQYVTAGGGIRSSTDEIIYVTGSNVAVDISANPQVSLGQSQQIMGIQCIGSNITLENGNGLSLISGQTFVMQSGSILNMIYNGTDNLWHETSRVQNGGI